MASDTRMDGRFWLKTAGMIIGLGILGLLIMVLFDLLIVGLGFFGAMVIVVIVLLIFAKQYDKRHAREYEDE